HSFPPAGQFAPPDPPRKSKGHQGKLLLMAHRSSFFDSPVSLTSTPDSGFAGVRPTRVRHFYCFQRRFYCLPASLSARRRKRGGGCDDDDQEQCVHLDFTSLLFVSFERSSASRWCAPAYQPALPPGGGRVVAAAITTNRIRAVIGHLA